jgi:cyclin-dependent kinase 7
MHAYQKGPMIGEGTYGSVICATHKASGRRVAIKKVRLGNTGGGAAGGVNMSVLRELKALRALACPHVVELLDTFSTKSSLVLVFEFMDWSLEDLIRDSSSSSARPLGEGDVKAVMAMMLQALAHVHAQHAAHR